MAQIRKSRGKKKVSSRIYVTLPEKLADRIDEYCELNSISVSNFIAMAATQKLNNDSLIGQVPQMVDVLGKLLDFEQSRSKKGSKEIDNIDLEKGIEFLSEKTE